MLIKLEANNDKGLAHLSETLAGQLAVWVVMPCTDLSMAKQSGQLMLARAGLRNVGVLLLHDTEGIGYIAVANKAFKYCSAPFIAYVAQDAFPGRDWLSNAMATLEDQNAGLCGLNDGKWAGRIASFGVVRKAWAKSVYTSNTLFFPDYQQHYADVELTQLAQTADAYAYNPNAVMMEIDWLKDSKNTNPKDKNLYLSRSTVYLNKPPSGS